MRKKVKQRKKRVKQSLSLILTVAVMTNSIAFALESNLNEQAPDIIAGPVVQVQDEPKIFSTTVKYDTVLNNTKDENELDKKTIFVAFIIIIIGLVLLGVSDGLEREGIEINNDKNK